MTSMTDTKPAETGEASFPNYAGTGYSLSELSALPTWEADARLAASIHQYREAADVMRRYVMEGESLLRSRIEERGGTVADCGDFMATLDRPKVWTYNFERLADLQQYVAPEDYEKAVFEFAPPPPAPILKANKAELNKLAKRGGVVKEIIDDGARDIGGPAKLVLTRRNPTRVSDRGDVE